jgi:pyruvate-formate lyase-activating enzyme
MDVQLIIISGGEPSLFSNELQKVLEIIKGFGFSIRIDTNGLVPNFLKLTKDMVDGFAVDIKIPLDLVKPYYYTILQSTKKHTSNWFVFVSYYQTQLRKTLRILSELKQTHRFILTRTVEYPQLDEEDKKHIEIYAKHLGLDHIWLEFVE